MKKILTLVFAVMLLVAMTAVAAAGTTVYVTVCVDGKRLLHGPFLSSRRPPMP